MPSRSARTGTRDLARPRDAGPEPQRARGGGCPCRRSRQGGSRRSSIGSLFHGPANGLLILEVDSQTHVLRDPVELPRLRPLAPCQRADKQFRNETAKTLALALLAPFQIAQHRGVEVERRA